jgi:hypothetical protein
MSDNYNGPGTITYHVPQVGEYYILMITNFRTTPCEITFTKTQGEGETDCEIVEPTDVLGFLITKDGEYLDIVDPDVRNYTDIDEFGEHEYCVRPIYPGPATLPDTNYYYSMGCPVCSSTSGEIVTCDPGEPIYAEVNSADDQVHIWWGDQPGPGGDYTFYFGFENDLEGWRTIDQDGDGHTWVNSIYSETYSGYDYIGYAHGGDFFVYSQSYYDYGGPYNANNYLITPQKYSIVYGSTLTFWADNANDDYPDHFEVCISTADDPTANTFTSIWSHNGAKSGEKTAVRHTGNRFEYWRLHSVDLSDYVGQEVWIAFHHQDYDEYEIWIDDVTLSVGAKGNRDGIIGYNIYRSTDNVNYTLIATVDGNVTEYFDAPGYGTYYYQVTALYVNGCESDPAVSGFNPNQNYVVVGVTGIGENSNNVNLFPNPTKDNVTIQAMNMHHITVVSALGQVVFDTEVDQDEYILDMSKFNTGIYMVRVYTDEGVTMKRVTVLH